MTKQSSSLSLSLDNFALCTPVGNDTDATCVAIRCAIDNFQESGFKDRGGEPVVGAMAALEKPWRGQTKQVRMVMQVISDCLIKCQIENTDDTALLLCLAESGRVGRVINNDHAFFSELCSLLGSEFSEHSRVISQGAVSVFSALYRARRLMEENKVSQVIVAAVDSLMVARTLADLEENDALLSSENFDGIIPGEGAGAFRVRLEPFRSAALVCQGLGFSIEKAIPGSGLPFRADGLVSAINEALRQAECVMYDVGYRTVNAAGDQFSFKEASLALTRTLKTKKDEFDILNPADCVGDMGCATAMVMLASVADSCFRGYAPDPCVIAQLSNRDGRRSAGIFHWNGV